MYINIDYTHLALLGEVFAGHIGRSDATVSNWIVGHARLFSRARENKGCNAHTYREALVWFDANWPADLDWPADVPRPVAIVDAEKGDAA